MTSSPDRACRPMADPVRIQRSRAKGWRMPKGAIYVGRPTKWGNPVRVDGLQAFMMFGCRGDANGRQEAAVKAYRLLVTADKKLMAEDTRTPAEKLFWTIHSTGQVPTVDEIRSALRGRDLACFCRLDQPCHADVLLEIANS